MDSWKGLLHELPVISFDLVIWSCEVLILLAEVKPRDQEYENCNYERHQQSQHFVADVDTEMLILCPKKGGSDS